MQITLLSWFGAAAQSIDGDVAKEALDHVQPPRRGGREMHVEPWMLGQPRLHCRMLVRGVVVSDQMQHLVLGRLAVDLLEKLQPLDVGVALLALANDLTVEHIERGEQRGRAIALVVVRHGGRAGAAAALLRPPTLHHGTSAQRRCCPGVPLRQTAQRAWL